MEKQEKDLKKNHNHVRRELRTEKKISYAQIIAIVILLALGIILALFSEDKSYIAQGIRSLFNR